VKASVTRKVGNAMNVSITCATRPAPGNGAKARISPRVRPRITHPMVEASAISAVLMRALRNAREFSTSQAAAKFKAPASSMSAARAIRTSG
jgi:hypothetical protein